MARRSRQILVNDKMQQGYRYTLVAPAGRNFRPDFRPELTPKEMLALGVFCGKYMTDCRKEFPASGSRAPSSRPRRRDCSPELISASMPASRCRSGAEGLDSSRRSARLVPVVLPLLHGPPNAGGGRAADRRWRAIRRHVAASREGTASRAISTAGRGSARRCCIGPMTAA